MSNIFKDTSLDFTVSGFNEKKDRSAFWDMVVKSFAAKISDGKRKNLECSDFPSTSVVYLTEGGSRLEFANAFYLEIKSQEIKNILVLTENDGYFLVPKGGMVAISGKGFRLELLMKCTSTIE